MKKKKLIGDIEDLRNKLNLLIIEYGEKSEIVLHCSQELDKLLNKMYYSFGEKEPSCAKEPSDEDKEEEGNKEIKKSADGAPFFRCLVFYPIDLCS